MFFSFLLFTAFGMLAQNKHLLIDTVLLDEVVTFGELRKYQSGARKCNPQVQSCVYKI